MASILENAAVRDRMLPISIEQYHALGEAGLIGPNAELLHGVILEKMVKSPEHSWLVQRLVEWLRNNLPQGYHVRQEQPITCADSEPEPDVAVVVGAADDYRTAHPQTAALVIEVAISSEVIDREKASVYAAAGVPQYWLILPHARCVESLSRPQGDGYAAATTAKVGDELTPLALPGLTLRVADLFG